MPSPAREYTYSPGQGAVAQARLLAVLDRALAVLDLDVLAVCTVTLTFMASRTSEPRVYERIVAVWKKAGVAP